MDDEEHLGVIELAVSEMKGICPVIAGVGSNDTRHAVKLTERATELGADALLSVNPYYNRPNRRGIVAHYREVVRATELPIVLYNIPQRTGWDMSNDLLAELAQLDRIEAVKQANPDNLAKVDGLSVYAGNDDMLVDVLDLGEAGGILTSSHLFGEEMRRMVDEPERRREIDQGLQDVYRDHGDRPAACSIKSALEMIGVKAGRPRLPYVPLDDAEQSVVRAMLERHGVTAASAHAPARPAAAMSDADERKAARPAARRPGRDRQEHDGARVRGPDRRRRHRPAVPDHRHARDRPRAARLHLSARARRRHRGDRDHARSRGPSRRASVGVARAAAADSDSRRRSTAGR